MNTIAAFFLVLMSIFAVCGVAVVFMPLVVGWQAHRASATAVDSELSRQEAKVVAGERLTQDDDDALTAVDNLRLTNELKARRDNLRGRYQRDGQVRQIARKVPPGDRPEDSHPLEKTSAAESGVISGPVKEPGSSAESRTPQSGRSLERSSVRHSSTQTVSVGLLDWWYPQVQRAFNEDQHRLSGLRAYSLAKLESGHLEHSDALDAWEMPVNIFLAIRVVVPDLVVIGMSLTAGPNPGVLVSRENVEWRNGTRPTDLLSDLRRAVRGLRIGCLGRHMTPTLRLMSFFAGTADMPQLDGSNRKRIGQAFRQRPVPIWVSAGDRGTIYGTDDRESTPVLLRIAYSLGEQRRLLDSGQVDLVYALHPDPETLLTAGYQRVPSEVQLMDLEADIDPLVGVGTHADTELLAWDPERKDPASVVVCHRAMVETPDGRQRLGRALATLKEKNAAMRARAILDGASDPVGGGTTAIATRSSLSDAVEFPDDIAISDVSVASQQLYELSRKFAPVADFDSCKPEELAGRIFIIS